MAPRTPHTDVLVVGGGPVGLSLGLELSRHGVDHLLLEAGDGQIQHPRVGTVGPRTMELYRRWGVADTIRQAGWPDDHPLDIAWVTALGGHEIFRIPVGTAAGRVAPPYTPEPEQVCPQHWLQPLLTARLRGAAGSVRLGHRLDGFVQHDDRVEATVSDVDTGTTRTVTARFLVACDGAASPVRKACGIGVPSRHPTQIFRNVLFRAPELRKQLGDAAALVYFLTSPRLLRYPLRSMDGRDLYRLTARGADDDATPTDPYALINEALAVSTPVEVLSDENWHLTHRVATAYRQGRVFLCGDAAHTLSPSGGFGMNTGVADAADLGWKLAAELAGWAGGRLLDSYAAERMPVAEASLEQSHRNLTRTTGRSLPPEIVADTAEGARARAALAERMAAEGVGREFDAPDLHFGYRYRSELIVADPDPGEPGEDWSTSALPGGRAPHAWIAPGISTLDLIGTGFTLLHLPHGGTADEDAAVGAARRAFAGAGVPLTVHELRDDHIRRLYRRAFVLIRPDGHVSWRGDRLPADPRALADAVRGA
nr:RebC-like monooxygenase [uncultured bacterium]